MDLDTLYAGATAGDTNAIVQLEKKADRLNKDGTSILHIESMYGNTERVRCIVTKFAHKNLVVKVDAFKQTALHLAVHSGYTDVVEVLIDAARRLSQLEAFVRQADDKMNTALHLAVANYNMAIAKMLVEADPSDRHIQNHDDETPMYLAAKLGYPDIVRLICTTCTAPSLDGPHATTALHPLIINWNNEDEDTFEYSRAAKELIDAAKRSACYEDAPYNSFEALFSNKDANGYNVLQLAVQGNNSSAVGLILDQDPAYQHGRSSKNKELKSLIYIAAEKRYNDVVRQLCLTYETGNTVDYEGQITLQAAIIGHDRELIVGLLNEFDLLVTYEDDYRGWTPLHYAAYYKYDLILDFLVRKKKSVKCDFVCRKNVPTPLHIAAKEGHSSTLIKLLQILPQLACDVNGKGENILHILASQRKKNLIQSVFKYIPVEALNQKDENGNTPLHILVREGCYVPEFIIHEKVSKSAVNNQNRTPFDMLYLNEEITGDQVQYKMALDNALQVRPRIVRVRWKLNFINVFGRKLNFIDVLKTATRSTVDRMRPEFETAKKLLIEEAIKRKKDELKLAKDDLERYRNRTSTQIIVTALITTVTFTVGFTMPGGYHQNGEKDEAGLALLSKKTLFKAFMVSDALALMLSTSSLFFYFIASMSDDPRRVSKLTLTSTVLNIVSVIAMMLTFVTGTYVVLSNSPNLAITVCVICCIFFILLIVESIKMIIHNRKPEKIYEV